MHARIRVELGICFQYRTNFNYSGGCMKVSFKPYLQWISQNPDLEFS